MHPLGKARMLRTMVLEVEDFLEDILPLRRNLILNIPLLRVSECNIKGTLRQVLQCRDILLKDTCSLLYIIKDTTVIPLPRRWARMGVLWEVML